MGYKEVVRCRICGNQRLSTVLDLGEQVLTGVFPRSIGESITRGPLRLTKCEEAGGNTCGLLQLQHSYDLSEMYGENYGYRSGLNASMVGHLHRKIDAILQQGNLRAERHHRRHRQQRWNELVALSGADIDSLASILRQQSSASTIRITSS